MELYDVAIIGSGPAGTSSALALKGKKLLMLDVGYSPEKSPELTGNLYDLRSTQADLFDSLIGKNFESLHNLFHDKINYKLKSPYMNYIVKNWQELSPVRSANFETMMSFAKGGLANGWGGGVFQFNNQELLSFPITAEDLAPYYEILTKHIGISGINDDLSFSFGTSNNLLPPTKRSDFFTQFFRYQKHKGKKELLNIIVGAPRLAILSQDYGGRSAYRHEHLDFFKPHNPAVYNPAFTLEELERDQRLSYLDGHLVLTFREFEKGVEITAKRLADQSLKIFRAKKLILAAGALNSAKIVLQSYNDTDSSLPILDNPMVCIPFLDFKRIGAPRDPYDSPIGQLNLIYNGNSETGPLQASLYGISGALRTDLIADFPLSLLGNMAMSKYLTPATGVAMLFYPGKANPRNYLKLNKNQELEISCEDQHLTNFSQKDEVSLMRAFRKMGYLCLRALNQYPKMGNGIHYAGTLPMQSQPGKYQCDANGKLAGLDNVYVSDGAAFSSLPAKNLTFTIMANAMRIANKIGHDLR